ncbi:hypothetical protein B0H14DRAFT_3585210 [Mycena olivaceomarginata]|nr:hypothetical protein B0H14DRAFT_3585210 [Mycena olivaceomarginata]
MYHRGGSGDRLPFLRPYRSNNETYIAARRTPSPNEEKALYQGGGDRYGDLGHGLPSGLPSFRHEPQYQYHGNMDSNVGHVANQTTAFNSRVPSSNTNPRASAHAPQRVPSSMLPPDVDYQGLVAQLGAMALKQDEMQAQLHAQNELQTQTNICGSACMNWSRLDGVPGRGTMAQRGKTRVQRGRAVSRISNTPPEVSEPSDGETASVAANSAAGSQETFDLTTPSKSLPTRELQRAGTFCSARSLGSGAKLSAFPARFGPVLPFNVFNDVTPEAYLNPVFDGSVTHPDNQRLFTEVAKQVSHQLQDGPKTWPPGLSVPNVNVTWTDKTLIEMSKTTFRSCKVQWRQQVDSEVAKRVAGHNSIGRRRERRFTKAVQRDKAIPIVADKYGIDPKIAKDALLHEQHMSDEYSGPEDRDETSQAVWRTKMAYEAGYDKVPDSVLAKTDFVEVAETPWRSEKMSKLLHELSVTAFDLLSPGHKKKFRLVRVRDTGRAPSDIPARRAIEFRNQSNLACIESEQPTVRWST